MGKGKSKNWYWLMAVLWVAIILAERACTA